MMVWWGGPLAGQQLSEINIGAVMVWWGGPLIGQLSVVADAGAVMVWGLNGS